MFYDFLRYLKESANLQILLKLYLCAEAPGKIRPFAMWPLAMAGSAGRPNSSNSGEGIGQERVWGGGGAHPRPICHLARGRGTGGEAGSGAGRRPPLEQLLRRVGAAPAACGRAEGSRVGAERGVVGLEDRGAGRGDELGDSLPWRTAAALPRGWCCVPSRGTAATT
jgi:hypothetical protein